MTWAKLAICGLTLCVLTLSSTYERSSVFEHPTQSAIISFCICGLFLIVLQTVIPKCFVSTRNANSHNTLSFQDIPLLDLPRDPSTGLSGITDHSASRKKFILVTATVVALCFRIETFRLVLSSRQCTVFGTEGCVPLILAIYHYCFSRPKHQNTQLTWRRKIIQGLASYLMPGAILSVAVVFQASSADNLRSTYICPHFPSWGKYVPVLQIVGAFLDCFVLVSIEEITRRKSNSAPIGTVAPTVIASIFLLSAAFLFLGGFIAFITHPGYWRWTFAVDTAYFYDLMWCTGFLALLTVCGLEFYLNYGLLHLSFFVTIICTYFGGFKDTLSKQVAILPTTQILSILPTMLLFTGTVLYFHTTSSGPLDTSISAHKLFPRSPPFFYIILFLLFAVRLFFHFPQNYETDVHPIDLLMRNAAIQSKTWLAQATTSKSLTEAAQAYRQRYNRHPPPGFDSWYNYTIERSSIIIDDYDSIFEDLAPFWAHSPTQIRSLTRTILSDEWNEVGEISIRSGKAEVGPNVRPTHRWMLDGVLTLLENFVDLLPDMDLAFNINDEPRVAIPWKDMQINRQVGSIPKLSMEGIGNEWSSNRAESFHADGSTDSFPRPFEDHSFDNSFARYGSIACPPDSLARTSHTWDPRSHCLSCMAPHSLGLFLQNWTLSASPCHQPDLAHLHGLYLSPAAFKASHHLLPIFSQSKADGYADIIYPSAWNYIDKVKYEPSDTYPDEPFQSKKSALFWRGATSEGLSRYGTWKGMARQRLVHLANNATRNLPVLLPHPTKSATYSYSLVPPSSLPSLGLDMDIAIVDEIARCWDSDCDNQAAEFGLVGKSDFQAHWGYRYLFDLDGAGFSGRFLPFLQSHSLVFKSAVFREWWDSRVTAWRHFVPVDVRFQGLLSTLAYFTGTQSAGEWGAMEAHLEEGESIAEAGRDWAAKVLRKEDMEIYMFRLLLEWGRLTDDRRDEIGYVG